MNLPTEFLENLKNIAKHYPDGEKFLNSFSGTAFRGIRANTLKCSAQKLTELGFAYKPTPFCKNGFYIDDEFSVGNHPLHHAGAYYSQEPSATSAVTVLDPKPNDYVLDLCAAPGGKSTQIAAALGGTGLIWSNEPVSKRAEILVSNFERMGIANGVISATMPDTLCPTLEGCFDKVLVDAPCSGEGMIRKEPKAIENWSRENVLSCANRQLKILNSAAIALRAGGSLVYSTCTYSYEENEGVITEFLSQNPDFYLVNIEHSFGRQGIGMPEVRRIFTVDGGEGHFVALLKKHGDAPRNDINFAQGKPQKNTSLIDVAYKFFKENGITLPDGTIVQKGERLYLVPNSLAAPQNVGVLRCGLLLNEPNPKRFVPSHALYMCPFVKHDRELNLTLLDPRVTAFLHGEEIEALGFSGYTRVLIERIPCGFGKASGGRLKNYYPKGLRTL